jgi:integrase/recombinase XerD
MAKLGKQAKILSDREHKQLIDYCNFTRYSLRNKVMVLLSFKAGLRAKEISQVRWRMILDPSHEVGDSINLEHIASKGDNSGRIIPLNYELKQALIELKEKTKPDPEDYVLYSQKGKCLKNQAVIDWFGKVYKDLRLQGCSSHSGRRTFGTKLANIINIRELQALMGHSSMNNTSRYIEVNSEAQKVAINKI